MSVKLSDHFTYKNIFKAVAAPIFMMIFTSIYSIVDGIFIVNFAGSNAFAGANLIYPITMIVGGFGFMLGTGGAALVSKTLGEKDNERANKYFSMILYFTILGGLLLSLIGFFLIKPCAYALAKVGQETSQETIDAAILYGRILMGGQVLYIIQNLFQSFFIVAERPRLGFIVMVIAGVTNIVLDALFVGLLKLGVMGAAIGTVTSYLVGSLIPILYFIYTKTALIKLVKTKIEFKPILKSCYNGFSEFASNISGAIVGIVYNIQFLRYIGEIGVNAYGAYLYIQFIFIAIFFGYSAGVGPIIGYNYGAENHEELKNVLKKSLILISITSVTIFALSQIFAGGLCKIFASNDQALYELSLKGMRICTISFLLSGFCIFTSAFFTALNNGMASAVISILRTFVFQLVTGLVLPLIFDLDGLWWAIVTSEGLATIVCIIFLCCYKKKYHY